MRALALLLVLAAVPALAQPTPEALDKARAHFKQGRAYQDAGAYAQAVDEFKAAYALDPRPELLFNIAQVERLAGKKAEAVEHYRQYLEAEPNGKGADEARRHVVDLTKALEAESPAPDPAPAPAPVPAAAPAPVPVPAPAPAPEPRRPRLWTWVAASVAVALLAGGAVMWIRTDTAYEAYEMSMTGAEWEQRREVVEDRQTWTRVLLGGAGAAAAGATVFYVLEF